MSHSASLQGWLELRSVKGLGPITYTRLINRFGSPEAIRTNNLSDLVAEGHLSPSLIKALHQPLSPESKAQIKKEMAAIQEGRFSILTLTDDRYPARLKMIPDPPPILYFTGDLHDRDIHSLAIVRARKGSQSGRTFTRQLSGDLAADILPMRFIRTGRFLMLAVLTGC